MKEEEKKATEHVDNRDNSSVQCNNSSSEKKPLIPLRRLGRTELMVSCIGLGAMGVIGKNHPNRESGIKLVDTALDRGINFIDTSRVYYDSEEVLGCVLKRRRQDAYIATKTYLRSAKNCEKEIETSLRNLQVKTIDIYQNHHVQYKEELDEILGPGGAMEALKYYQKQGAINFIGISSHNPVLLPEIMEMNIYDTVQFPFNAVEQEHYNKIKDLAKKYDVGTIIMKPLAGGHLTSVESALKFILSHDISTVIPGCSTLEQVMRDTQVGINFTELSDEEKEQIIKEAKNLPDQFCRRCRYCEKKCPKGIAISDIFRCEDYLILNAGYAKDEYRRLSKHANDCINCGQCEKICPYQLPVREKLQKAHKRLNAGKLEAVLIKFLRKVGLYDIVLKTYLELGGPIPKR